MLTTGQARGRRGGGTHLTLGVTKLVLFEEEIKMSCTHERKAHQKLTVLSSCLRYARYQKSFP